jgi:hypothetical protein
MKGKLKRAKRTPASAAAATRRAETRDIPRLSFRASVEPATLDEKKRTVEVIWTTGARVLRGFFDRFWEELSLDPKHVRMGRLTNGAPLLDSHREWGGVDAVLGVVESARLEKERGIAVVRFASDEVGEKVFAKVKDGILRHVSVGYQIHRFEQVEGGDEEIPVYRATDWEPYEISLVPMGADAGAGVRAAAATTNPCEFLVKETTMKTRKKTAAKNAAPAVTVRAEEAEQKEPVEGDDTESEDTSEDTDDADGDAGEGEDTKGEGERGISAEDVRAAERKRLLGIERAARVLGIDDDEFVSDHRERGTSVAKFTRIAMRRLEDLQRKRHPQPGAVVEGVRGGDAVDKYRRQAVDAILQRIGRADTVIAAAKKRGETITIEGGELRGMSLLRLAAHSLERAGIRTRDMGDIRIVELAFNARAGGYQTTSDFPLILDEVVNRTLLADYELADDTWRLLAKVGSVQNFKPSSRVRLGGLGRLDRVPEHSEFKNKPLPDGTAEQVQIETFGNIFAITRQVIVDDDLGAIMRMVGEIGRTAGVTIEEEFWALLNLNGGLGPVMSDGLTLFHADHGNIQPTGTALTVAGLDLNNVLMTSQTDPSGRRVVMRPHTLLVSTTQRMLARNLNDSEFDIDIADGVTPNGVRNMFERIIDTPEITSPRRYIFADPQRFATFEVNFLNGQQTPYTESRDGWRIDGKEFKVRHDVGVDAVDWRTAITDDGQP